MRRPITLLICINSNWRVTARNIRGIISTSSIAWVNILHRNSHKFSTQMLYNAETSWTLLHVDEFIFDIKWMALLMLDLKNIKLYVFWSNFIGSTHEWTLSTRTCFEWCSRIFKKRTPQWSRHDFPVGELDPSNIPADNARRSKK